MPECLLSSDLIDSQVAAVESAEPAPSFETLAAQYGDWMAAVRYSPATVRSRRRDLKGFAQWCELQGVAHPRELDAVVLERYRLKVHGMRKADGRQLGSGAHAQKILAVKQFLKWTTRMRITAIDAGAAVELPRRPRCLPRNVLSVREVERVLACPDTSDSLGVRDRAIMETLYSTGIRRSELIRLRLAELDADRGMLFVREGKGGRDRVVPIGVRALSWIHRYLSDVRPGYVRGLDPGFVFLTRRGRPLRDNRLTELVHRYVSRANVGKSGSCHMFRHTMATLMLDHGADVRYIQELLGHAQLTTTELYTRVSIARLKEVHRRTHPAELAAAERDPAAWSEGSFGGAHRRF